MIIESKLDNQDIERLDVDEKVLNVLRDNKVRLLKDLCKKSKSDLRKMELLSNQIKEIEVELELLGMCLKDS